MPQTFAVLGHDARQTALAALLAEKGFSTVHTCSTIPDADTYLLPLPSITANSFLNGFDLPFSDFLKLAKSGSVVWGAGLNLYRAQAAKTGIRLQNYGDNDAFASRNAIPTAEGAIQIAMQHLPTTISGGHFLVIGYGRIGSALAAMLHSLGGNVTVATRTPGDLPCRTDKTGAYCYPLPDYDVIFNTVPFPVFSEQDCAATRKDCLLVDLASAPGGIANTNDRKKIHALGIPAKYAPKTAAQIMLDLILSQKEDI